jgi:hypothetical protein
VQVRAFYQNYVGLENGSFPQGLLRFWLNQYKVVYCCIETQFQQAVL